MTTVDPTRARWERDVYELRAEELDAEVNDPPPGRFNWRRIPGTSSLAITNLLASGLLVTEYDFNIVAVHTVARTLMPTWIWGLLFLLSGLTLVVAVASRRWIWLNIGSAISIFTWTAMCLSALASWITGAVDLSPIAASLFFWMLSGQVAMLITPLLGTHGRPAA